MQIVIQPPGEARPGNILMPPTTISLRSHGTSRHEEELGEDINSYWVFVSVVSADGMVALAPPSTTLLSGTLTDSIHEGRLTEHERDIGHSSFQNLVINQAGDFRLRFSLIRMQTSQHGTSTGGLGTPSVRNITSVLSHIIHVAEDTPAP
ncbi:MAG: hypothetical protein Q9166_004244 [cf. Caloplaca sp. 2 TL-2023]